MEAVGCYIVAKIKHSEGNDGRVFQNLGYIITHATGFNDDISEYVEREEHRDAAINAAKQEVEEDPYAQCEYSFYFWCVSWYTYRQLTRSW